MPSITLKHQLKFYLQVNQLKAAEFARRTNIPKQSISDWLNGVIPRSLEQLKGAAEYFKISLDELCFGTAFQGRTEIVPKTFDSKSFAEEQTYVVADLLGFFSNVTPSAAEILGWSPKDLCSRPLREFVDMRDRARTQLKIQEMFRTGETAVNYDNRYIGKDGKSRWIRWKAFVAASERVIFAIPSDGSAHYPKPEQRPEKGPINDLIEDCVSICKLSQIQHDFRVHKEYESTIPTVQCERNCLSSGIMGLLNQICFTFGHSHSIDVNIRWISGESPSLRIEGQSQVSPVVEESKILNIEIPKRFIELSGARLSVLPNHAYLIHFNE